MSVPRCNYSIFKYYTLLYFKISSNPKRMENTSLKKWKKKYLTECRAPHKHETREDMKGTVNERFMHIKDLWFKAATSRLPRTPTQVQLWNHILLSFLKLYHLEHKMKRTKETFYILSLHCQNSLFNITLLTVRYNKIPYSWPIVITFYFLSLHCLHRQTILTWAALYSKCGKTLNTCR